MSSIKYCLISLFLFLLISCDSSGKTEADSVLLIEEDGVRGVWIATPRHNNLMTHPDLMNTQLNELDSLGINTLFLCTWAENKTAWPSEVLLNAGDYSSIEKTSLYQDIEYSGDPVQDLIDQAHQRDMQVIFWFEYGFMINWGDEPDTTENVILRKNPDWAGRANNGRIANYNKSDYYFNSYHPDVQQLLLDLVDEALDKYPEVDGIQGDDRLPAAPRNSGYDLYTKSLYAQQHNGVYPPEDYNDSTWVEWRLDILNDFGTRFYELIKSKGDYTVAFSPNPYPWCVENLMQDWPQWVENGIVELLSVQCYRTNVLSYQKVVDEAWSYASLNLTKDKFVPGVLLGIGAGSNMDPLSLDSILQYNDRRGFGGESFFYVKWLSESNKFDSTVFTNTFK